MGRKRFRLLPPGSVPRVGGRSPRYDKWARLSRPTADEVTERAAHRAAGGPDVLTVGLDPGDVLHGPEGLARGGEPQSGGAVEWRLGAVGRRAAPVTPRPCRSSPGPVAVVDQGGIVRSLGPSMPIPGLSTRAGPPLQ